MAVMAVKGLVRLDIHFSDRIYWAFRGRLSVKTSLLDMAVRGLKWFVDVRSFNRSTATTELLSTICCTVLQSDDYCRIPSKNKLRAVPDDTAQNEIRTAPFIY
jgi:hypothetical protein